MGIFTRTGRPVLTVLRSWRRVSSLVGCGEQGQERADPESLLSGVPELAVVPDGTGCAARFGGG
jgi:hypothetical protein